MNKLFLIPARGGSKGILHKNIKLLGVKPLVLYSIEVARAVVADEDICLSSDCAEIIAVAENAGLKVPFVRPSSISQDHSSSREVILHALEYYAKAGKQYDLVVLLQPTSPFRKPEHLEEAISQFSQGLNMVVSVTKSEANPYYNLFEENKDGFLYQSKPGNFIRRQDCPDIFQYNGSIYVIDVPSIVRSDFNEFEYVRKYVMDPCYSIDLDTLADWEYAEYLLSKKA
jgi:CMP-N,N'-diacetyllegionaminic acid synthase